jgi:hypothetical protein
MDRFLPRIDKMVGGINMKTSTKWIIGILVGLVVVACITSLGLFAFNISNPNVWEFGMRSGRLWGDEPLLPRDFNPRGMPMHPFYGVTGSWFGFFGLLRFFGATLLCLGVPALLILAVILLARNSQKPPQAVSAQPAVTPPAAGAAQTPPQAEAAQAGACSNCGRQVQPDWSNCPYCGNAL